MLLLRFEQIFISSRYSLNNDDKECREGGHMRLGFLKDMFKSSIAFQLYQVYTAPTEVEEPAAEKRRNIVGALASLKRQISEEWNNVFSAGNKVRYMH